MTVHFAASGLTLAGRYLVGERLGRGGMGEVRSGWDKVLERPVAVKLLREDAASDPAVRRRFEAEARAAARLVHPNVVQVYDSGEDGGLPFIVMEKLPGRSLRDHLRTRRLSVSEASGLAVQVLAALEAAHEAGLIHRDIKPGNVLDAGGDRWKVADFGIAKSLQPTDSDETVTGAVIGTPAYLPPERLLGGDATPGGDVYAVGVILYEAIAGRRPFDTTDPARWVSAAPSPPVPLRHLRPDVPVALDAAIERSVSRDPSHRFATASEMSEAITSGHTGPVDERPGWLAVPPAMPGGVDRHGPDAGARGPELQDTEAQHTEVLPRPGAKRRSRLRLAGIVSGITALVATAAVLAVTGGADKARAPAPPPAVISQATTTLPPTTAPAVAKPRPGHDQRGDNNGGGNKGGDGG